MIDQTAILQAIGAGPENARPFCGSFFMCGTPMETKAGTAGLEKPDLEKAKALLKESGYDGRPVVFMQPSDLAANFNATVVVAEGMRKAGFKVAPTSTRQKRRPTFATEGLHTCWRATGESPSTPTRPPTSTRGSARWMSRPATWRSWGPPWPTAG